MAIVEYMEVDLHGDSDARNEPHLGEGQKGYIARLNSLAQLGWRVIDVDHDSTAHKRLILEREVLDDDKRERKDG